MAFACFRLVEFILQHLLMSVTRACLRGVNLLHCAGAPVRALLPETLESADELVLTLSPSAAGKSTKQGGKERGMSWFKLIVALQCHASQYFCGPSFAA